MRRKDREVTDPQKIRDVIRKCKCCRVGFCDRGQVYIVPLNFGYEQNDGEDVFYFHGAKEGRKIELIRQSPEVGFEMDTDHELVEGDIACQYTARFLSVIGNGVISMVTETEEKKKGLSIIMEHNTGKRDWSFDERMLEAVAVFKIVVKEMSCKEHL